MLCLKREKRVWENINKTQNKNTSNGLGVHFDFNNMQLIAICPNNDICIYLSVCLNICISTNLYTKLSLENKKNKKVYFNTASVKKLSLHIF